MGQRQDQVGLDRRLDRDALPRRDTEPVGHLDRRQHQRRGRIDVPLRAQGAGVGVGDHPVAALGSDDGPPGGSGPVPRRWVIGRHGGEAEPQFSQAAPERCAVNAIGLGQGILDDGVLRGRGGQVVLQFHLAHQLAGRMDHLVRLRTVGPRGLGGLATGLDDGAVPGPGLTSDDQRRTHLAPGDRRARLGDQALLEDADVGPHRVDRLAAAQSQPFGDHRTGIAAAPRALGDAHPTDLGGPAGGAGHLGECGGGGLGHPADSVG